MRLVSSSSVNWSSAGVIITEPSRLDSAIQRDKYVFMSSAEPLGPDSLTWRFFGDTRMALVGPRAVVLQNMLPALGQGVLDHSVFFAETFARV
ncbi:MAG: oxygenase MpaB family protein, partial [Streptosporangiaceae bacterium]